MKTKLLLPALILFATTTFFSCNKKDEDKSTSGLLTQAGWKIVSAQVDAQTGTYVNAPIDNCIKDDILTFNKDHTYTTTVIVQCNPDDANETGDWTLSADEKILLIDGDDATIETLDNNTLILIYTDIGIYSRYKITFGH